MVGLGGSVLADQAGQVLRGGVGAAAVAGACRRISRHGDRVAHAARTGKHGSNCEMIALVAFTSGSAGRVRRDYRDHARRLAASAAMIGIHAVE